MNRSSKWKQKTIMKNNSYGINAFIALNNS